LASNTSRGLAAAVSGAVGEGLLLADSPLPPIRSVAEQLGVSASTVSSAWEMLSRAGVIRTDGRRGTRVARHDTPGPTRYRRALRHSHGAVLDLSLGVPDATLLPDLSAALCHLTPSSSQNYLDEPLLPELREVLQGQWPHRTDQLTMVDGAMDAVDQVLSLLVRIGDTVIVEHPTFPPFLDLLDAMGARTLGVGIDDEGMVPEELERAISSNAKVLLCQPRSHNPTGISTSPRRAKILATVLSSWSGWVVEDDSAGSISQVAPISLAKWRPDTTVHIRSFSKSHGPDLRLAAVSAPEELMQRLIDRRMLGQGWTSRLLQSLLLDLLTRPASVAQVARARDHYGDRRARLVAELKRLGIRVKGADGLNVWLRVKDENAAMLLLASRGIAVAAGSPFETKDDTQHHVRITIATLAYDVTGLARNLFDAAQAEPAWGPR
ncbi:MAG TPA: aminotransferase class I/II-fold pyridoxal phosphate-dependent enzyme, partial [Acidimicrobiales bacterium]